MNITAEDILSLTKSVTKEWTKRRKAEERGRRSRLSRQYIYSDRVDFTAVADAILPGAYAHASGDGKHTVPKRTLYYSCRERFREMTGRELAYKYFANTLLVQYMNRHPETAAWKVTADPRGTLTIPNCGHEVRIPCGTIQIDNHLARAARTCAPFDVEARLRTEWPSLAAGQRYQAVLYIEKEGFEPVLAEAKIAERFDLSIVSCKGQSVVAARKFVDHVCRASGGVPLYVVHDMDKSGFEISQRLTRVSDWAEENDCVTYRFQNDINVTDLGLRLEDARRYDLAHERCQFEGGFTSDSICTPEERAFLRSDRRIELNAFTVPQFIEWLVEKLRHLLPERLVPSDDILESAYRRALVVTRLNEAIEEACEEAVEEAKYAVVPETLGRKLRDMLKGQAQAWDAALYAMVEQAVLDGGRSCCEGRENG
jgi:hypothetical protein